MRFPVARLARARSKLKVVFTPDPKAETKISKLAEPAAKSATEAMDRVGNEIKIRGRTNIAAAGFGKRWQNALRVQRYPRRGDSINPALWIFHNIPYAEVFESGARIRGKPLLWLPLPSAPKTAGGKRMTPKNYISHIGPLFRVDRAGKPPLLFGKFSGRGAGRSIAKRSTRGLRAGGSSAVPIFVGVTTVSIRKRFSLRQIFKMAASHLARYYASNVNNRGGRIGR